VKGDPLMEEGVTSSWTQDCGRIGADGGGGRESPVLGLRTVKGEPPR